MKIGDLKMNLRGIRKEPLEWFWRVGGVSQTFVHRCVAHRNPVRPVFLSDPWALFSGVAPTDGKADPRMKTHKKRFITASSCRCHDQVFNTPARW